MGKLILKRPICELIPCQYFFWYHTVSYCEIGVSVVFQCTPITYVCCPCNLMLFHSHGIRNPDQGINVSDSGPINESEETVNDLEVYLKKTQDRHFISLVLLGCSATRYLTSVWLFYLFYLWAFLPLLTSVKHGTRRQRGGTATLV